MISVQSPSQHPIGENQLAYRVLGITLMVIGVLITVLGAISPHSQAMVIITGLVVLAPGLWLFFKHASREN